MKKFDVILIDHIPTIEADRFALDEHEVAFFKNDQRLAWFNRHTVVGVIDREYLVQECSECESLSVN